MAQIKIQPNAAGTCVFTIASPGTNTDRTITLPDEAGTMATQGFASNAANITSGNLAAARITDALNASGSAPIYACRAWVNFNGTTSPGTIRASGNVSSVTRNGTGDYTVNFTTAMPDANYSVAPGSNLTATEVPNFAGNITASSCKVFLRNTSMAATDGSFVSVTIFR